MIKNVLIALSILMTATFCFGGISSDATNLAARIDGARVMVVNGSSMKPMLKDGDVIVVKPTTMSKLKLGMVCVYKNDLGELVAHSVVSISPLKFKGMNNKVIDSDKMVEIVGIMYGTFYNWNGEKTENNNIVLAKKY